MLLCVTNDEQRYDTRISSVESGIFVHDAAINGRRTGSELREGFARLSVQIARNECRCYMHRCNRVSYYGSPPRAEEDTFTNPTADNIERIEQQPTEEKGFKSTNSAVITVPTSDKIQQWEANSISVPTTKAADEYGTSTNVGGGDFFNKRETRGESDTKEQRAIHDKQSDGAEQCREVLGSRVSGMPRVRRTAGGADTAVKLLACSEHALNGMVYLGPR